MFDPDFHSDSWFAVRVFCVVFHSLKFLYLNTLILRINPQQLLPSGYDMKLITNLFFCSLLTVLVGCSSESSTLLIGTTTSTENTGLMDMLIDRFEGETDYEVKLVTAGTGAALKMAERGDLDLLLVHAPEAEKHFMESGYGLDRTKIMQNWFVLVGPKDDPADINGLGIHEALEKIAMQGARFVSRGDDSGTHKKEQALWRSSGRSKAPIDRDWYYSTGQGMSATLTVAQQTGAYSISDKGTWLATNRGTDQVVHVDQNEDLVNVYSLIIVNPGLHKINEVGAKKFRDFLVREDIQLEISRFGVSKYGEPLFYTFKD